MLMLGLLGRVWWLQTVVRDDIIERADRQQHLTERLSARRGSIFDSTGQLLAGTIQVESVFVDPKAMIDGYTGRPGGQASLDRDLASLAGLIEIEPFQLTQQIGEAYPSRFMKIADDVDRNTLIAIRKLDMPGLASQPVNVRMYPMGSLAAHILGGVGPDGVGIEGLERTQNKTLSGKDGHKRSVKDARRRNIGTDLADYQSPAHGRHLILSIDVNIQNIVEQELSRTCREFSSTGGEAVVLDPNTGDLLALANYPTFSPQLIDEATSEQLTNRALVLPYEPGSTIKPFIVARALNDGQMKLNDVFPIHGPTWFTSYGRRITDVHGYDQLSGWDVLVKSSNIGMSMIGDRLGNDRLYDGLRRFGFGSRTQVDLPGEDDGRVNPLRRWSKHSTHSIVQGYEMMVTPMQMACAMSTLANGGLSVMPRVIKGTLGDDGQVEPIPDETLNADRQIIDPTIARQIRRVLADVTIRGTATRARSDRFNIFGKTGTAHRAVNGSYNDTNYTASFVGGAPFESPRLVIAFVIHDPDKSKAHFGGLVSAPGASRILERSLEYLGTPESPPLEPPPPHVAGTLYQYDPRVYEKKGVVAAGD
jgi:cell division protein FtsI/penicillin-binding protein 2